MRIPYYHVDAFTDGVFGGNPAGVCLLESWLPDSVLQSIATENNLSETAFLVFRPDHFELRWFTPKVEVDLCGHATLAAAHVLKEELRLPVTVFRFTTQSAWLQASSHAQGLELDFPSRPAQASAPPSGFIDALGGPQPLDVCRSRDFVVLYSNPQQVLDLKPDFSVLAEFTTGGVIATAPGEDCDFVSRFFAPGMGIPEDPVTGSAHSTLIPYWAAKTGRETFVARQLSKRGGKLWCELRGDRVGIAGQSVVYARGEIALPDHAL